MVKFRRNFSSEREDWSMSIADEGKTSSDARLGPTNEERRACIWTAEKSWDDNPLTESTVRKKVILLPGGTVPGTGEVDRVEGLDSFAYFAGRVTLITRMSIRQDPMASAVYRQNIGTVDVEESRRERGARDISAFPMNEYSGGGES
jgi:hypothetical protein